MSDAGQAAVLDFLQSRRAGSETVRRIDTHCASIFLAGDRAWKMKRAVRFPYLDFSTPELRRRALASELELNRRTAPELYLGLHAITRDAAGRLALDGEGEPVDWVLEMRRFPDGALFSELADSGALTIGQLQSLTDSVADFHARAEIVNEPDGHDRLAHAIEGNIASLQQRADVLGTTEVARMADGLRAALAAAAALLRERSRVGRVRHVHGDLHLANIALVDGRPTPFDCLEFDAELATTDTLYDIAFLVMDLWQRGMKREANEVFNRYLDRNAEDEAGVALMPLFLAMRAVVRAHVSATQARREEVTDDTLAARARHYLRLAAIFLRPIRPSLVAVGGLSGSGKSTIARGLAPGIGRAPGARLLRSDVLRKRQAGELPETRLPQEAYARGRSASVYGEMAELAALHLAGGQSVIADAVFARSNERERIAQVARAAGLPFMGIWLDCDEDTRVERVEARRGDASDADAAIARAQSGYPLPIDDWQVIDATGASDEVLEKARRKLAALPS